jgi:Tfp pilus assembly protein PilF
MVTALENLAGIHHRKGRFTDALRLQAQAVALAATRWGDQHPLAVRTLVNQASLQLETGEFAAAEQALDQALQQTEGSEVLALDRAHALAARAALREGTAHFADADTDLREAWRLQRGALGERNAEVASTMNKLAALREAVGDAEGAVKLHERTLELRRELLGSHHPDVAESLNNLAGLRADAGDLVAASELLLEALEIDRSSLGPTHPHVALGLNNLATISVAAGRMDEAVRRLEEALALYDAGGAATSVAAAEAMVNLATLGLTRFDGHPSSGVLPRRGVHHGGHGTEQASCAPVVHARVQGRDR